MMDAATLASEVMFSFVKSGWLLDTVAYLKHFDSDLQKISPDMSKRVLDDAAMNVSKQETQTETSGYETMTL